MYLIEADDNSLYAGVTTDIEARFQAHLNGRGARYFLGRKPRAVVFLEGGHSRSSALKREFAIKQLSRAEKLRLITNSTNHR